MALMETPICEFGKDAIDFSLLGTDGKIWSLADCRGKNATLVMFICNHCPYVQAILDRLVETTRQFNELEIRSVAIMPNDTETYPEDGIDKMTLIANQKSFAFPYVIDSSQQVAQAYDAICTPDFFGYNRDLKLQYRGRFDGDKNLPANSPIKPELFNAMVQIAKTSEGPKDQSPSLGCSIKWRETNS